MAIKKVTISGQANEEYQATENKIHVSAEEEREKKL